METDQKDISVSDGDHENAEKPVKQSGKGPAWLAFLFALIALVGVGFVYWQQLQPAAETQDLAQRLDRLASSQSDTLQTMQSLRSQMSQDGSSDQIANLGNSINRLRQELTSYQQVAESNDARSDTQAGALNAALAAIQQRVTAMETAVASLAEIQTSGDKAMDLAEVDYLLRLGMERLELFSDPVQASQALELADRQLVAMNDPIFTATRREIAVARQALASVEQADLLDLSQRLASLQQGIATWPLADSEISTDTAEETQDEEQGWWQKFKSAFSGLVTVRRRVPENESTLTLEDQSYIQQGLWLQLENAQLALMRQDQAALATVLNRSEDTIRRFYQTSDEKVASALAQLAEIQAVELKPELPDISQPWRTLRALHGGVLPSAMDESVEQAAIQTADVNDQVTDAVTGQVAGDSGSDDESDASENESSDQSAVTVEDDDALEEIGDSSADNPSGDEQ